MSIRSTARQDGIPPSILRRHLYGLTTQRKREMKVVLTDEEEQKLVQYLLNMQNLDFLLTLRQLREKVGILTNSRVTTFKDDVPGVGWVKCFKNHHPQLTIRKALALDQK